MSSHTTYIALAVLLAACGGAAPAPVPPPVPVGAAPASAAEEPEAPVVDPCTLLDAPARGVDVADGTALRREALALDGDARRLMAARIEALEGWRAAQALAWHQLAALHHLAAGLSGAARARSLALIDAAGAQAAALGDAARRWCGDRQAPEPSAGSLLAAPGEGALVPSDRDESYRLYVVADDWMRRWKILSDDAQKGLPDLVAHFEQGIARLERVRLTRHRARAMQLLAVDITRHMIEATRGIDAAAEPERSHLHGEAQADAQLLNRLVEALRMLSYGQPEPADLPLLSDRCDAGELYDCYTLALARMSDDPAGARDLATRACRAELRACVLASAFALRSGDPKQVRRGLDDLDRYCTARDGAACFLLARELDAGQQTPQDRFRAQQLWLRACREVGGENACQMLNQAPYLEYARDTWAHACDFHGTLSACRALGRE